MCKNYTQCVITHVYFLHIIHPPDIGTNVARFILLDVLTLKDGKLKNALDRRTFRHYIDIMPYTTLEENATLQVYDSNSEQFLAILRRNTVAARQVAGGIASTGAELLTNQGQVLAVGIEEVYENGSQLAILNDTVNLFTVGGEHLLATITSASGWIVEQAGASWGWIEFRGRWIRDGGSSLLKLRRNAPDPVKPPGMIKDYQADEWPPGNIPQGNLIWIDILIQDSDYAWANQSWAFLSQSEQLATQNLVIWNNSGGFQVGRAAWTSAEGREPVVSAENTLDTIPIPWRLRTQSGVKYLQAQVRYFADSEDAGYFLPRQGFGRPVSGTIAPLSMLLFFAMSGGIFGNKLEKE